MSKKITMTDIAKKLGVSQTLVSFVLSGKNDMGISAETKKKVLDTAEKMGYCSNAAAKMMKLGRSGFASVVFVTNPERNLSDIIACSNSVFSKFGYNITILGNPASKADIEECKKLAQSRKVDGFIIFGEDNVFCNALAKENIPFECIGSFEKQIFSDLCKRLCEKMLFCDDDKKTRVRKSAVKKESSVKRVDDTKVSDKAPEKAPARVRDESIWLL